MTVAMMAPPTNKALVGAPRSPESTSSITSAIHTEHRESHFYENDGVVPSASEISALNGLVVAVLDNADEYRRAIFAVEQLLDSLQRGLYNRVQAAEQIQSQVRALGAQPATTLSSLAAALAARLKTRVVFAREHHEELLRDAARGEEVLQAQFKQHFKRAWMSISSRACISRAFDQIMTGRTVATEGEPLAPFDAAMPLSILSPIAKLAAFSPAIQAEQSSQACVDDQLRSVHELRQESSDDQSCATASTIS